MRGQLALFGGLPYGETMETEGKADVKYTPCRLEGSLRNDGSCAGPTSSMRGTSPSFRAAKAIVMIFKGKRLGSRAFDNLFEQGDGNNVADHIIKRIESDLDFARAVMRNQYYMDPGWVFLAQSQIERDDRAWDLGVGVGAVK